MSLAASRRSKLRGGLAIPQPQTHGTKGANRYDQMQLRRQLGQWFKEKRVSMAKISREQEHLYKVLLQSHAELKGYKRDRGKYIPSLDNTRDDETQDLGVMDKSRVPKHIKPLPSLGDSAVDEWLKSHTESKKQMPISKNDIVKTHSVNRLVIQQPKSDKGETNNSKRSDKVEPVDIPTSHDLGSSNVTVTSEAKCNTLTPQPRNSKIASDISAKTFTQEGDVAVTKSQTIDMDKANRSHSKVGSLTKAPKMTSLNTFAALPPITEDTDESTHDRPSNSEEVKTTSQNNAAKCLDNTATGSGVYLKLGGGKSVKPLPSTSKPWFSKHSSIVPAIAVSAPEPTNDTKSVVSGHVTQRSGPRISFLSTVTRRRRKEEELLRRKTLNNEPVLVYEQDGQGGIILANMDHHRRSFPLPTTREQRMREKMLAAQQEAAKQQLERMNSFLGHIGAHVEARVAAEKKAPILRRKSFYDKPAPEPPKPRRMNNLEALANAYRSHMKPPDGDPNSYTSIAACRYVRMRKTSPQDVLASDKLSSWGPKI